jgi:3-isopropylmalate dehydrogenase
VREPERFDVLLATNFYGDILSDLASELSGSLGLAGSIMSSDELCCAQAQHGSAPIIAGQDIANPVSMILSVAMLLAWLGKRHGQVKLDLAAACIDRSVDAILENPATRTADLQGAAGCRSFTRLVADRVVNA